MLSNNKSCRYSISAELGMNMRSTSEATVSLPFHPHSAFALSDSSLGRESMSGSGANVQSNFGLNLWISASSSRGLALTPGRLYIGWVTSSRDSSCVYLQIRSA